LREFHLVVKGALVDVAFNTPSTYSSTLTTPTLSVVFTFTETVPLTLDPLTGEVIVMLGGTSVLETVTTIETLAVLPAASRALAVKVCVPFDIDVVFQEKLYGAELRVPSAAPSALKLTEATATLSLADTWTVTVPDTVAPFKGETMLTVGGVVSGV